MAEGGATAPSLPGDAIFAVLSRVPVKSVCRFRCVCKDWLALISDPAFVVNHKYRAAPEQLLVGSYCDVSCPPYDSSVLVMDMDGKVLWTIRGLGMLPIVSSSLDNLVCFSGIGAVTRVVDVTTGKVLVTSSLLTGSNSNSRPYAIAISLGRAAVSNSTKVVRLTEYSPDQPRQTCEVLTLGGLHDSVWRLQARSPPTAVRVFSDESSTATVNGVVHFLSSTYGTPRKPAGSVLCFDLETEEWSKMIQGPLNADTELDRLRLAVLNETLCMIQTEECQTDHRCANMWLLVDADKSIWVKKYTIPMPMPFYMIEPLKVMPDGVKLLLYYSARTSLAPVLRVHDPSVGTCTEIKLPKDTFHKIGVCNLHLDCFVTPVRSSGSRAESTFNMRIRYLDAWC